MCASDVSFMIFSDGRNNLRMMDEGQANMLGEFGTSESEVYRRLEKFRRAAVERNKAIRARQLERWSRVSVGLGSKQGASVRYACMCVCVVMSAACTMHVCGHVSASHHACVWSCQLLAP
jgi:hypothetical protein